MKLDEVERTELEYRAGSSDKVYIAILEKNEDNAYRVTFRYGKRWQVNNTICKPESGTIPYGEAKYIYEDMISKKLKKGYSIRN